MIWRQACVLTCSQGLSGQCVHACNTTLLWKPSKIEVPPGIRCSCRVIPPALREWPDCRSLHASSDHHPSNWSIQARLFFLSGKNAHVGPTAAVERGPSQGARSGNTGPTWVPFPSFHRGASASKKDDPATPDLTSYRNVAIVTPSPPSARSPARNSAT